jgi:hypothetical protein
MSERFLKKFAGDLKNMTDRTLKNTASEEKDDSENNTANQQAGEDPVAGQEENGASAAKTENGKSSNLNKKLEDEN